MEDYKILATMPLRVIKSLTEIIEFNSTTKLKHHPPSMHCHRQRDLPCSPIDQCSVSAHFALSPPSRASISAAVSPPGAQNTAI